MSRPPLTFAPHHSTLIAPYMPPSPSPSSHPRKPHTTLTFATSLDSNLALSPGTQTPLSGPLSKALTHYLRSRHTAILIGVGTAIADDPSLNCRIAGVALEHQPRPVVLDPHGRWPISATSSVVQLAREGQGRAPWIITCRELEAEKREVVESVGGQVFVVSPPPPPKFPLATPISWPHILALLSTHGITSLMIEGGGTVINTLLHPNNMALVDSVIVTIAPVWLGRGGVQVCPEARADEHGAKVPVSRLRDVQWVPLGEDVVLCGRPAGRG
ncbi:dihydrofolate reductase-like domain-containing protein [Massariosphaeria phaeospora]|uniref:2,5-diamino-6-ribosylamino-4(3H)-pyrimidinone 5'-phosphate reductase n=1 Tax=Massariosphaeria phaeospora TaxID=100035 RepID=A0A7C8IC19_9PLEO|nr:dihydrofolate reductase-like domain-containing protein [Massariosphaeria phaeospora]